jgi:hemerythrin
VSFFTWQDKFNTGHEEIDKDHHILVDLIGQLHDAFASGHGHQSIGPVLSVLAEYTDFHFKREEELMDRLAYPKAAEHRAEHDSLRAKVFDIQQRYEGGEDAAIGNELLSFLHFWLYFHILDVDMHLRDFLEEKGLIPNKAHDKL